MIKLKDFAASCGVTDRAIQKHLKNHETELKGHFERRGKNGTWLDEHAQEFIRGLMIQQPVVVADSLVLDLQKEKADLEKEIKDLLKENKHLWEVIANMEKEMKEQAQIMAKADSNQKLLESRGDEIKELKEELKGFKHLIGSIYVKK